MRRLFLVLLALVLAGGAIACNASGTDGAVRVGSKDFAEQFILGEVYALALEANGLQVERKLNLGGTPVAQAGLESGEIDLYPEYTGTSLLTVLKLPKSSDREEVYRTVSQEYRQRYNLVWLDPSPMSNSQALVVTSETARAYELETLSDLAGTAEQLVAIGTPEFQVREDGLPGLRATYGGFEFAEYKGVDPGLRYPALLSGEADVAVGFSTDGEISAFNLVLLEDDKGVFPPYQVAPVVRQETLDRYPEVASILNRIAPKITDKTMQTLNYEVTGNQREPAEVAREFWERIEP